jgi:NADPH-dependent ferric siderophore reductase
VPAVLSVLEHAPASLVAEVFLEVPETADLRTGVESHIASTGYWRTGWSTPG